ncbi:MAG: radical SAM protein [Patescibacteria group bacterium]
MVLNKFEQTVEHEIAPTPKILKGSPEFFESKEKDEKEDKNPIYLMMNLETKCSYRCPKCALPGYRRNMKEPLSLEQRKKLIIKAREIGIKELVIVGAGEPTEHFDETIKPVIEAAHHEGIGTIMFTTTSHLTREQAEFYRDHDVSIFVSLDSIDSVTYKELTGTGNLEQVLENIQMLKKVFGETNEQVNGKKVVRLGINVTVVVQNKEQLDAIKKIAGDEMQFIVNFPIKRGKFKSDLVWQRLVGEHYAELQRLAEEKSDTGGHSSIDEGVCSYFNRGVSVDIDGQMLSCGYASETAHALGSVADDKTLDDLAKHYREIRQKYVRFSEKIGKKPSCPLRDEDYKVYLEELGVDMEKLQQEK